MTRPPAAGALRSRWPAASASQPAQPESHRRGDCPLTLASQKLEPIDRPARHELPGTRPSGQRETMRDARQHRTTATTTVSQRRAARSAARLRPAAIHTPTADMIAGAITAAIHRFGLRRCAARMAQEFGDHPETAAARMRGPASSPPNTPGTRNEPRPATAAGRQSEPPTPQPAPASCTCAGTAPLSSSPHSAHKAGQSAQPRTTRQNTKPPHNRRRDSEGYRDQDDGERSCLGGAVRLNAAAVGRPDDRGGRGCDWPHRAAARPGGLCQPHGAGVRRPP